jgi:hypothetical protein
MAVALVPYAWKTDDGMPHWALPDNVTSAIDLRPLALMPDQKSVGYAVAVIDGDLPEGSVEFTGNETRDRDAWESTLKFRPTGGTVEEIVWSHLTDGADDAGEAACRPLRCHKPDRLELHLGGRKERQTTATERLKQAVLIRADLARMVDDESIPRRMLGKFLQAEADRMGIDAITLRGKGAKLRDIRPERPETTITDPFRDNASFIFLSAYTPSGAAGSWTVAGENGNRFQTGNNGSDGLGSKLYFDGGGGGISIGNASNYGWHPTSLSLSNNTAILEGVGRNGGQPALGPLCRGNGTTSGYTCDNADASLVRSFSLVANVGSSLGTGARSTQTRDDLRAWASGSTIRFSDKATGAAIITVTNTALTVGLRVGVHGYSGGGENNATGFSAYDDVPAASRGRRARLLKRPVFWLP